MRKRLFEMYLANRPLAEDLNITELAELTEGYASSDIPFVVNEAALFAAIADQPISQTHLTNVIKNHPSSLMITKPNRIGFQ
jgi:SpoVK/Ycf46/Vps4 family AAA+-type ATPase